MKKVWKFTNQRELTASEFVSYFERKVKKTIGKYKMPIGTVKGTSLNANVLNHIMGSLPQRKGKISEDNLDDISILILDEMMHGNFELSKFLPHNQPLYFLSDKEIQLYAKIKGIKGKIKEKNGNQKEINEFIKKIEEKNPDIRHNIINSLLKQNVY